MSDNSLQAPPPHGGGGEKRRERINKLGLGMAGGWGIYVHISRSKKGTVRFNACAPWDASKSVIP